MSTDPAITVEWTVPTEDDEWGGGVRDASDQAPADECAARDAAAESDDDRLAAQETPGLPPAPVLAARVDHLRSEREARERQLDAVRDRYETLLAARNEEIRKRRSRQNGLWSFVDRLRNVF